MAIKTETYHHANQVPKPWVEDLYPNDPNPPPEGLLETSAADLDTADLDTERYYQYDFHRLEVEHVWKKTWQMACRAEEIPDAGDYLVYDIVDDSVVVVRGPNGDIAAYTNSCLHRGTTLVEGSGNIKDFRCPYHGWTYDLNGALKYVPGSWDFAHLDLENTKLLRVKIDFWGGFVFVNLDEHCDSLANYLGVLPKHLNDFHIENRYKALHVSQVVPCNWKVAQEAFIEGYHVAETHFEKDADGNIAPVGAAVANYDTSIQNDYWSPHISRMTMLSGIPSRYIADQIDGEQGIIDAYFAASPENAIQLAEGQTARSAIADHNRDVWKSTHNVDFSEYSDAEMIDQIEYTVFPNFTVWPTVVAPLVYRFRPYGDDPSRSLFEVWMLYPVAADGTQPEAALEYRLEPGEAWASVKELGAYGPVIDQDMPNLPRIQKGLMASVKKTISLGNYQESRIRALHETLDLYIAGKYPLKKSLS